MVKRLINEIILMTIIAFAALMIMWFGMGLLDMLTLRIYDGSITQEAIENLMSVEFGHAKEALILMFGAILLKTGTNYVFFGRKSSK